MTHERETSKNSCYAAEKLMEDARQTFAAAVQGVFPMHQRVTVRHANGKFDARVVGHEFRPSRVIVRNLATGKTSNRYFGDLTPSSDI